MISSSRNLAALCTVMFCSNSAERCNIARQSDCQLSMWHIFWLIAHTKGRAIKLSVDKTYRVKIWFRAGTIPKSGNLESWDSNSRIYPVQGISKRLFPDCMKSGEKVAFCLPSAGRKTLCFHHIFSQPGKSLIEIPCIVKNRCIFLDSLAKNEWSNNRNLSTNLNVGREVAWIWTGNVAKIPKKRADFIFTYMEMYG